MAQLYIAILCPAGHVLAPFAAKRLEMAPAVARSSVENSSGAGGVRGVVRRVLGAVGGGTSLGCRVEGSGPPAGGGSDRTIGCGAGSAGVIPRAFCGTEALVTVAIVGGCSGVFRLGGLIHSGLQMLARLEQFRRRIGIGTGIGARTFARSVACRTACSTGAAALHNETDDDQDHSRDHQKYGKWVRHLRRSVRGVPLLLQLSPREVKK